MHWYLKVLKNYVGFQGRAQQAEYWMFALFNVLASVLLTVGDFALGTYDPEAGGGLLTAIYALAIFLPSLAVTIRRLHDTGRTGWWCLIAIVPCVGAIVLIVFLAQAGERGSNAYGPDPREATA